MNCHPRNGHTDRGLRRIQQPLHKCSLQANKAGAEHLMLQQLLELYEGVVRV